ALKMPPALRTRGEQPETLAPDAKALAEKSFAAGYLKDALKYLKLAHENDPVDFSVMLKLGWTLNMSKDDRQAIEWFRLARKSPDAAISEEAARAYKNLRPSLARTRTTAWFFPFYSTRWQSLFSYAQVKTEFRVGSLPLRPYLSTRFIGDSSGMSRPVSGVQPQYLSESSFIFGAGVATSSWKGLMGWAEAGTAVRYVKRNDVGKMVPDYRGGAAFARSFGQNLGPESKGWVFDTNADAVFISRFDNDTIAYSQNRFGYTLPQTGPVQAQFYLNGNLTADVKRQYWANFVEYGPGVKFRLEGMPQSLLFSVNALRGQYTVNDGNPRGPKFTDFRVGLWYAFTY
ncbi:MAG: tetratricopeptide repeat protein, partial [Bryobacteraceae bacterium]